MTDAPPLTGPTAGLAPPSTPPHRRSAWRGASVAEVTRETDTAKRIVLEVPDWPGNDAGSHLDVRLTAEDGYQATRSYSIASSGDSTRVVLAVDELRDGEVSPYLVNDLRPGDMLEVNGPLGAYFVWRPDPDDPRPVQLIAGGSGVVPLFAMAGGHAATGDATRFRLLYSVRTPDDVFFVDELTALAADATAPLEVEYAYTRAAPDGWDGSVGRLTRDRLAAATIPASEHPRVYVCGPTAFVEAVADWLLTLGHEASAIRTERFGGS